MERGFRYKEGDEVAHAANLEQKMFVSRIIKKIKKEPTGKMCDGKPVYENQPVLLGIECHWWQETGGVKEFKKHRFHSRELLPWEIAQKRQESFVENQKKR